MARSARGQFLVLAIPPQPIEKAQNRRDSSAFFRIFSAFFRIFSALRRATKVRKEANFRACGKRRAWREYGRSLADAIGAVDDRAGPA